MSLEHNFRSSSLIALRHRRQQAPRVSSLFLYQCTCTALYTAHLINCNEARGTSGAL